MEHNLDVDKSIITQDVIDLYHDFTHGDGDKRRFMKNLSLMVGGMVTANNIMPVLENDTRTMITRPDDDRLNCQDVSLSVMGKDVYAYQVEPERSGGELPCVVIIHENRGLNSHIKDIARRMALEGFLVIAPDAVSLLGRRAANDDEGRAMMRLIDKEEARQLFLKAIEYLADHKNSNGRVGCVGFCWGGSMAGRMAVGSEKLDAAVVYYGGRAKAGDVPKIRVPMMMHYAEMDSHQMAFLPDYCSDLDAAGVNYDLKIWRGAQHAFNNDSNAARYDRRTAHSAWSDTLSFLNNRLG